MTAPPPGCYANTTWTTPEPASVVQDALPHLVYGAVTVLALHRMIDSSTQQVR